MYLLIALLYLSSVKAANITSCDDIINKPGTWELTQNIKTNESCLTIESDDVLLNCNFHSITGSGNGTGIFIGNKTTVEIVNCSISNFSIGLEVNESDIVAQFNTIHDNDIGILIDPLINPKIQKKRNI